MEVKHQVFVSSTYKDLIEERKEVIHALLELDCIPAGMELFPATDEDAWSLITEVIDDCDYYILILAGKYGSTDSKGIGYTEMEFDYASSRGMPIICFIHENTESLASAKVESSDIGKQKLEAFRKKAQEKHCKFWSSAHDLGGKVSRSLIQLKKRHPSEGWVPGRYAADQKMLAEVERMRARIAELELNAMSRSDLPPSNYDQLRGGSDSLALNYEIKVTAKGKIEETKITTTWDNMFAYCGAALSGECTTQELAEKMRLCIYHAVPDQYRAFNTYDDIILYYALEDQIRIQLQALGLIEQGTKKRAVSDTNTYWKLTPFGEKHLVQVKAIKRKPTSTDKKPDTSNETDTSQKS